MEIWSVCKIYTTDIKICKLVSSSCFYFWNGIGIHTKLHLWIYWTQAMKKVKNVTFWTQNVHISVNFQSNVLFSWILPDKNKLYCEKYLGANLFAKIILFFTLLPWSCNTFVSKSKDHSTFYMNKALDFINRHAFGEDDLENYSFKVQIPT